MAKGNAQPRDIGSGIKATGPVPVDSKQGREIASTVKVTVNGKPR
jgi:hypothetical protein